MKHLPSAFTVILGILSVLTLVGYDCLGNEADPFRNGEARYLMLAFIPCVGWALWACQPAWALFWCWSFFLWVVQDWHTYGMMDVLMILTAIVVGDAVRSTYRREGVARVIAYLAVFEAAYVHLQVAGLDPFFHFVGRFHNEAIGTLGHFTLAGPFIGFGALYFFNDGLWPKKNAFCFSLCVSGIIACHSTMTYLSVGAAILYVVWRRVPGVGILCAGSGLGALFAAYILYPGAEFFGLSGREVVWPYVLGQWLESPYFGQGPGHWAGVLPITNIKGTAADHWYQAHNDFLQVLPEQGLVGLAIIIVGLYLLMRKAQKMQPIYGAWVVLLCVDACANFTFHVPCFGLLGAWLACTIHHHERPEISWKK